MIVMKFGGTSVGSAEKIRRVVRIVKEKEAEQPRRAVVISAMGKTTRGLLEVASLTRQGRRQEALDKVAGIVDAHRAVAAELFTDGEARARIMDLIVSHGSEMGGAVSEPAYLALPADRVSDAFVCHGERMSSAFVAVALEEAGLPAVLVDAERFMVTDENYGGATPLWDEVGPRIDEAIGGEIARGHVVVTQGYISRTHEGIPSTLGLEGSDFTASIVGSFLKAEAIQIWTDVDGVMSADPRVVDGVRKLDTLSFEEAQYLSLFGAKVLHPRTIKPAWTKKIPIVVHNTMNPGGSGTVIGESEAESTSPRVKSIAHKMGLKVLALEGGKNIPFEAIRGAAADIVESSDLSHTFLVQGDRCVMVFLDGGADHTALVEPLERMGALAIHEAMGSVCLIGDGIAASGELGRGIEKSLEGKSPLLPFSDPSGLYVGVALAEGEVKEAVNRLHDEFVARDR